MDIYPGILSDFVLSRRGTSCFGNETGRVSGNYLQKLVPLFTKTIEEASAQSIVAVRSLAV